LVKKSVSPQLVDHVNHEPSELAVVEKTPCAAWRFRVTHSFLGKGVLMGDPSTNPRMEHSSLEIFLAWTRERLSLCTVSDQASHPSLAFSWYGPERMPSFLNKNMRVGVTLS
jgi:hypothetical protein